MRLMNKVTIDVRSNGTAFTISVDPFVAHALPSQPMEWHIKANAHVQELEISAVDPAKWPFTGSHSLKSNPGTPASAEERVAGWKTSRVRYKITGTCNGHDFVLDPDMIVD